MHSAQPRVIAWETTRRCALRCKHCRGAARDTDYAGELSTDECLRVIDSIAACSRPILILTGGEPMSRPDIYTLARHATDAGLRVVMAPCGHLITPERAQQLKEAGVMALSISLDGATGEAHDAFRGVAGAYARTIEGVRHAAAAGIPFQVNTTVTRANVDDLPVIHALAIELGASKFDVFFLVPTGRGAALREQALSPVEAEQALYWVLETSRCSPIPLKVTCAPHSVRIWEALGGGEHGGHGRLQSPATGCMAGDGFVFVSHTGMLQPCGFLDVASGDLRGSGLDFKVAYEQSQVFGVLRARSGYQGKCGACEYVLRCGGCRARAYAATGDYLAAEPGCSYVPQAMRKGGRYDG